MHVLPEHADELRRFAELAHRRGRIFLGTILALVSVIVGGALLGTAGLASGQAVAALVGLAVAALGLLLVAFPFTTPETITWLGIRRSIRTARLLGILTIVLGLWIGLAS